MSGRRFLSPKAKYGFNGQMKDNEVYGEGNSTTAEFWQYDPRLGRRWNIDPKIKEYYSDYLTFGGNPILHSDVKGDDHYKLDKDGSIKRIAKTKDQKDYLFDSDIKKFVIVDKGLLDKMIVGKASDKPLRTYLVTTKTNELQKIYEFAANHSNVEWSMVTIKGKNQISILATFHSDKSVGLGTFVIDPLMTKNKNISIVSYSHSHPGKFNPSTQWPAYPSGFHADLTAKDEAGDRKGYERFSNKFPNRVPAYFDVFIPNHPEINVFYNDKEAIRTNMPPVEVQSDKKKTKILP